MQYVVVYFPTAQAVLSAQLWHNGGSRVYGSCSPSGNSDTTKGPHDVQNADKLFIWGL